MPWPGPPHQRLIVYNGPIEGGDLTLSAEPDGTLKLTISGERRVEFVTCSIKVPFENAATFVAASWTLPQCNLVVGDQLAFSTESPDQVPSEIRIRGTIPNDRRDFSVENRDAVKKRADTLAGTQQKPHQRRRGKDEIFEALRNERVQLNDLIAHVERGENQYIPGLARLLRLLIADNTTIPLLQLSAAHVNRPLIVCVPPITKLDRKLAADLHRAFPVALSLAVAISPVPSAIARNTADLDFWLESWATRIEGRPSNQRELIQHIANNIGSHFALDAHPIVDILNSIQAGIEGAERDLLVNYLRSVARVSLKLIDDVLA